MKLVRFGTPGSEKPGLVDESGTLRDLSAVISDVSGEALSQAALAKLAALDASGLPAVSADVRLGPCVGDVGKFICIGLNYIDHCEETGADVPEEPVIFMKATSAINGPFDPLIKPPNAIKMDWEVELGIVIGRETRYADEAEALESIAGYCVINDVSERHFQKERGGTWDKGKGCDTFGPLGPWLVTRDDVPDPCSLDLWLSVNGEMRQQSSTRNMVFKPAFLVSYISQFMSLQPGDIISTGTPPGVALGMENPVYLKAGDTIELGVDGLGTQRQVVVDFDQSELASRT